MQRIAGNNHHNNQFTEGNTATNGQATQLTADFLNSAQEELVALAQINNDPLDSNNNNQAVTAINNQISTLNTAISTLDTEISTLDTEISTLDTKINTLDTKTGIQEFSVDINSSSYTDVFHFTHNQLSSSFIVGLATRTTGYTTSLQLSVVASFDSKLDVKQLACSNDSPFLIKIIHDTNGGGVISVKLFVAVPDYAPLPLHVSVRTLNATISTTIPSDKNVFTNVYEKYVGYPENLDIDTPVRIWHNKGTEELFRRGYLPMVGRQHDIAHLPDYYKSKISNLSTSSSDFSNVITQIIENSTVTTRDRRSRYLNGPEDFRYREDDALSGIPALYFLTDY